MICLVERTGLTSIAFLAPDRVEAMMHERQPVDLNSRKPICLKPPPALWIDQRRALKFPAI